jgi:hypothetical protein
MFLTPKQILKTFTLACVSLAVSALSVSCTGPNGVAPNGTSEQAQVKPAVAPAQVAARPPTEAEFETWRLMIQRVRKPENACAMASYPETQWRAIRCVKPPNYPFLPANGIRPTTVGNGTDWSSAVTGGHVSFAQGSFHHVSGVTSENQKGTPNDYSLQLNTQFFTTKTCTKLKSPDPSNCRGWEQFIYATNGYYPAVVFIQYWLINFGPGGTNCPPGWNSFGTTEIDCFRNSLNGAPAPAEKITNMGNFLLYGAAAGASMSSDAAGFTVFGSSTYAVDGDNRFPDLDSEWAESEFNIFGNCCGNQAVFNTGSKAVVRLESDSGVTKAPSCAAQGFTGETNNLYLVGESTIWPKVQYPSIVFTESNAAHRSTKSCVVEPAR